jgi:hypothetical protein
MDVLALQVSVSEVRFDIGRLDPHVCLRIESASLIVLSDGLFRKCCLRAVC